MRRLERSLRRSLEEISGKKVSIVKEFLQDTIDTILETIYHKPRRVYESIKRVVAWLPIIWKDRDWDYSWLLHIIRYKLQRMEDSMRKHSHHSSAERSANEIRTTKLTLDRLINDDYYRNASKTIKRELGNYTPFWGEDCLDTKYERPLSSKQKKYYGTELRKAMRKCEYMRKQDTEFLFKYLQKHYEGWWH